MTYRLLEEFQKVFDGRRYLHRASTTGDRVARHLCEDLVALGKSDLLLSRVRRRERVLNKSNRRQGKKARRGDGTFGEIIPGVPPVGEPGFEVFRGPVATVEIGVEVKILQKAMIKQIDRVQTDLANQAKEFAADGDRPICVGIVGINHASHCTAYDGDKVTTTDGKRHRHPVQEAAEAKSRLVRETAPHYGEFLILEYRATNEPPYPFSWVDQERTQRDYGATLTRVSREYDRRFP